MSTQKIISWNLNSLKARFEHLQKYVQEQNPDILLLQETKTQNDDFPEMEIRSWGYHIAKHGQKTYNGVAILSKDPIEHITTGLPGMEDDDQARYIEATINNMRVASIYVPNGQEVGSDKFAYKMQFYAALKNHMQRIRISEQPFVLGGDFNVAFDDKDVHDPRRWEQGILFSQPEKDALREITNLGFYDTTRIFHPGGHLYSWWDYRAGAWEKDHGLRIDYIFTSPQATDHIINAGVDKQTRGWEKPSDHAPVWIETKKN